MNTLAELDLSQKTDLGGISPAEFTAYYRKHHDDIQQKLRTTGAVKFSGVHINSLDDFQGIVDSLAQKFLNYVDGNSPRTKLTGNVYTSTEYDQTQRITMHNELSYSAKWPNKLFFSCLVPAAQGGETLLADSREILNVMSPSIVSQIEKKGITYIRNLHAGSGIGPTWQSTFETESREQVERYCRDFKIQFEWRDDDCLRLFQPSPGIILHHQTGERMWFNQIDQFHPSHLGEDLYESMMVMYDSPEDFPMFVRFGNGEDISEEMVKEILQTIDKVTIAPEWNRNELLIVDNELVAHGRNSYTGDRKVLVAMSE